MVTCGCGCGCGGERRDSLGLVNELGRARTDRGVLHITGLGEARDITERVEIIFWRPTHRQEEGKEGVKGGKKGQKTGNRKAQSKTPASWNMTGGRQIWSNWGQFGAIGVRAQQ